MHLGRRYHKKRGFLILIFAAGKGDAKKESHSIRWKNIPAQKIRHRIFACSNILSDRMGFFFGCALATEENQDLLLWEEGISPEVCERNHE